MEVPDALYASGPESQLKGQEMMRNNLNNKRINGAALEMIMRDVLDGMTGFTRGACSGSETGRMEILAVEEAVNSTADRSNVIPFPGRTGKA